MSECIWSILCQLPFLSINDHLSLNVWVIKGLILIYSKMREPERGTFSLWRQILGMHKNVGLMSYVCIISMQVILYVTNHVLVNRITGIVGLICWTYFIFIINLQNTENVDYWWPVVVVLESRHLTHSFGRLRCHSIIQRGNQIPSS